MSFRVVTAANRLIGFAQEREAHVRAQFSDFCDRADSARHTIGRPARIHLHVRSDSWVAQGSKLRIASVSRGAAAPSLGWSPRSRGFAMAITDGEFEAMLADRGKTVEGDLDWREDEDHSPAEEFRATHV